jgi:RND family efflux transporter MFP subunit
MRLQDSIVFAILVVLLLAAGCGRGSSDSTTSSTPPAEPAARSQAASPPATPSPQTLEILSVLSVERSVDLLAQRDGVVQDVFCDQDSWVEKGATLAKLDDREIQARLDRARLDLEVTSNNLKYQQAERKAKEAAYRRQQELQKHGLTSEAALEEAEFRAKGAAYDEKSWEAGVQQKQAQIRELEVELEKTRLVAPFSAFVVRRSIRAGQNVIKNDPCFRLSQLSPLQVHFLVPEVGGGRPKPGDALKVIPVGDSAREYEARIQRVSPTVDPASGSYDVTAQLSGSHLEALRPGMAVRVLWPTRESMSAF